jgi:hypothetical protein
MKTKTPDITDNMKIKVPAIIADNRAFLRSTRQIITYSWATYERGKISPPAGATLVNSAFVTTQTENVSDEAGDKNTYHSIRLACLWRFEETRTAK